MEIQNVPIKYLQGMLYQLARQLPSCALDSQERGSIEDSYLWKRTKTQNKSLNLITPNLAN